MSASADLHDVWNTGRPLGLSCNHCLHRALVPPERIGAREGNLQCVDTLPFRCTKCGHRTFTAHLFKESRHVKRFMAEYR
jgi:DNA-directed RNA polymerase subunit RPC12/RpoP